MEREGEGEGRFLMSNISFYVYSMCTYPVYTVIAIATGYINPLSISYGYNYDLNNCKIILIKLSKIL